MDLKEIKRLVTYARNAGIHFIKVDGLEIQFKETFEGRRTRRTLATSPAFEKTVKGGPAPTLEDINDYIYGQNEELG